MRRTLGAAIAMILLAALIVQPARPGSAFVAPGIGRAGDIAYPTNVASPGIVTLMVNLDNSGNVQNLEVLRDVPALTGVASAAVKGWGFTPASLSGQSVASVIPVSVVFNPFNPAGVGTLSQTISLSQAMPSATAGYNPPQITAATYATYPVNSTATGAVVLDVKIAASGNIDKMHVVHGIPSLTPQATKAVKTWTFNAATYQGTAISSHIVVAIVFPSPGTGSY
jgi:outer membrane biosynthesis protein TonB